MAYHNNILFPTCTVPCGFGGPLPSGSSFLWNMWPQPIKRRIEEAESTFITTAHGQATTGEDGKCRRAQRIFPEQFKSKYFIKILVSTRELIYLSAYCIK